MSIAGVFRDAYAAMDPQTGMFPKGWTCKRCGRELDDGTRGRPAELYAGTYTGLCYPCTNEGPYVSEIREDGCQVWSYPPHCPSWRRDRETFYGYPDCDKCKGSGVEGTHYVNWSHIRDHCRDCMDRMTHQGAYETRGHWERYCAGELSREEAILAEYIANVGHEPRNLPPEHPGYRQWTYKTPRGAARRDALVRALAAA